VIKTFSERLNLRNTILTLEVPEINSEKTFEWVQKHRPDLIIVSGTNLMNKNLINEIKAYSGKIINLHTGLSPYINGGPNSTNWCLALNRFEWIGNTVMSLDAGIDSGPILATERVNLSGTENLYELQMKVLESAQSLYLKVIRKILDGKNIEGVQQKNIARGQTFYTRAWTPFQMIRGLRNFKRYYTTSYFESETFKKCCSQVTTISIESESMGEKDNGLPSM
jgi:methionyl-tRNA formyltransferase